MAKIIQFILKNWKYISFVLPYIFKFINKLFTKRIKIMEDTREGFLTPEQEKTVDDLIELKGVPEMLDGTAIKLADNKGLQALKPKIVDKWGEGVLDDVYEIIDMIFIPLKALSEKKED